MKKRIITFIRNLFILLLLMLIFIVSFHFYVSKSVEESTYTSTKEIPYNKVGMVLGTAKYLSNSRINLYYKYRIDAIVELYNAGKIEFILVSGDNSTKYYDEPSTIKKDLVERGIPESKIFLDYAGFRTLDSMVRSKEIFGQHSITVVSQKFHNERALFISQFKDINAIGFNAQDVNIHYGFKTQIRESLARIKMAIDLILGKEPKFLGEQIEIK
jgi:SanA protein